MISSRWALWIAAQGGVFSCAPSSPASAPALDPEPEIQTVSIPIASVESGSFTNNFSVTLTCPTAGAAIYWTLDPEAEEFEEYTGPVSITGTGTLRFFATKPEWNDSDEGSETYTLGVSTPVLSPGSSSFTTTLEVTASCLTSWATLRYTNDGSDPSESSPILSGTITLAASKVIKVRGFKTGYTPSATASATYTYTPLTVAAVTFSPTDGHFIDSINVTMTCVTPGATIHYTTNGSVPTSGSPGGASPLTITVSADAVVKAFATKSGYLDSVVTQKTVDQLTPVEMYFDRSEFETVFWDLRSVAIPSGSNIIMRVSGTACTFQVIHNGASLFGELTMGIDGQHDGTLYGIGTLSGPLSEISAGGDDLSYFRLGGDTSGYTLFQFYVY